jgi:hypothetical protein
MSLGNDQMTCTGNQRTIREHSFYKYVNTVIIEYLSYITDLTNYCCVQPYLTERPTLLITSRAHLGVLLSSVTLFASSTSIQYSTSLQYSRGYTSNTVSALYGNRMTQCLPDRRITVYLYRLSKLLRRAPCHKTLIRTRKLHVDIIEYTDESVLRNAH